MDKKIRFGVIGTNNITDWVIAGARQDKRFELTAVCSRTQERADEFAAKHNIPHTFTSLEEMAQSDLVDAIYIATPNYMHARQSIVCMENGKHVLCEKPFASNAAEAKAMIEAAHRNKVVLMEAMISTLNPNFAIVKKQMEKLGTIRRYFASYCQYSSRYDKFKEGIILNAFKPELSNGAVMDIGIYTIYPMVALFGRPEKVEAQGIVLHTGVDGQGAVNLSYKGMNATVLYSKIANSALPTEIEGENGNLLLDKIHITRQVDYIPRQVTSQGKEQENIKQSIGVALDKSEYFYEIEEFLNVIEQGELESKTNSHFNSLTTMEIIDEIRRQLGVHYPADDCKNIR